MRFFTITLLLFFASCDRQIKEKRETSLEFKVPIVTQKLTSDTLVDYEPQHVADAFFRVEQKSSPTDTAFVSIEPHMDTSIYNHINRRFSYSELNQVGYDGFELQPDYKTSVYKNEFDNKKLYCYYPIYLINKGDSIKHFPAKDSHAFGIQEAIDSFGRWRPIEGRGFDFCGNGNWDLGLKRNEFVMILVPKYKGDYHTKIRVRLKVGDIIYVTRPFDGAISYKQFSLEKGGYFADAIREDKTTTIQDLFYGSIPLGMEIKNAVTHAVYAQQGN